MNMKTRHIKQQKNRTVINVYLAVTIAYKLHYLFNLF